MKKLFASKLISFFSLILFMINIFIVWNIYSIHSSLERDAKLINNIGFIRGSTQRIFKFELLKNIDNADYSVSEVDKIFAIYLAEGKASEFRFDPEIIGSSTFNVEFMKPPRPESGPRSGRPW